MADSLDSVNKLLVRYRAMSANSQLSDGARENSARIVQDLELIKTDIVTLRAKNSEYERRLAPLPSRLGDLSDLPKELLDELSAPRGDELDMQIMAVVHAYGGTADLDQILVGLYRKFSVVTKRRFLQNKVWRMSQREMLWSIRGRKGVYTVTEPADGEKDQSPPPETDEEIPF